MGFVVSQVRRKDKYASNPHPNDEDLSLGTPNPGPPGFVVWEERPLEV
jgi:hypothetical protein